jgi:hypothetical protein
MVGGVNADARPKEHIARTSPRFEEDRCWKGLGEALTANWTPSLQRSYSGQQSFQAENGEYGRWVGVSGPFTG